MSHNNRKRKHRPAGSGGYRNYHTSSEPPEPELFLAHHQGYQSHSQPWSSVAAGDGVVASKTPDALRALYIQAHEADIIHGNAAHTAAQSLEVVEYRTVLTSSGATDVSTVPRVGSALIQWTDGVSSSGGASAMGSATDLGLPSKALAASVDIIGGEDEGDRKDAPSAPGSSIWVDRYDARLLLNTLPSSSTPSNRPASPSGWSDIASDAEDTFFFTPDEAEDYHREKRRRLLQQSREERLRARMQEGGVEEAQEEEEDIWGGSDEEPDETQNELMARTATHLLSSPNPAQLEMRILANHGGDKRFAFLRGRWKNAWNLAKAKARLKKRAEEKPVEVQKPVALTSALAGYGSGSDSDSDDDDNSNVQAPALAPEVQPVPPMEPATEPVVSGKEVSAQELRRQRLEKWREERKAKNKGLNE